MESVAQPSDEHHTGKGVGPQPVVASTQLVIADRVIVRIRQLAEETLTELAERKSKLDLLRQRIEQHRVDLLVMETDSHRVEAKVEQLEERVRELEQLLELSEKYALGTGVNG